MESVDMKTVNEMALEAWGAGHEIFWFDDHGIERFAALVAAAEREACAKACEDAWTRHACAAAIRARGQEIDPNQWAFDNGLEST
jgi:hypothetical protein